MIEVFSTLSRKRISLPLALVLLLSVSLSGLADKSAAQKQQDGLSEAQKREEKEHRLSPQEAAELFGDLEKILKFVSDDTRFPIKNPVKHKLGSRDEVQKYIEDHFRDDEDAKRMEQSELVLKKFGLLPREFELKKFLVSMLREQVAGFYDQKTKQMFLLDWLDPDSQRPVMAHELTHALQDQNYDLEKWDKVSDSSSSKSKNAADPQAEIDEDEESSARSAVVEGQGMIVLLDYMLAPTGRTIGDSPDTVNAMRYGMEQGSGSPIFNSAPLLLKESLVFPYRDGMGFIYELFLNGGRKRAFDQVFAHPPRTTHDILFPKAYLNHEELAPVKLPPMKKILGERYSKYDVGSVGQFDVEVLLKEFANARLSEKLTPDSLGGAYFAALHLTKSSTKGAAVSVRESNNDSSKADGSKTDSSKNDDSNNSNTAPIALLYISRWKSPDAARKFAGVYAASLLKKYKSAIPVSASPEEASSTPTTKWNTEEGPVSVEPFGNTVLILEGFDDQTAAALRDNVKANGPKETASLSQDDLNLRYTASLRTNAVLNRAIEGLVLSSVGKIAVGNTALEKTSVGGGRDTSRKADEPVKP